VAVEAVYYSMRPKNAIKGDMQREDSRTGEGENEAKTGRVRKNRLISKRDKNKQMYKATTTAC